MENELLKENWSKLKNTPSTKPRSSRISKVIETVALGPPVKHVVVDGPAIIEKLGYVVTVAVLHGQARISATDAMPAGPDLLLGVLFIAAFAKTQTSDHSGG